MIALGLLVVWFGLASITAALRILVGWWYVDLVLMRWISFVAFGLGCGLVVCC